MSNVLKALARGGAVGEYQISRSLRFNSADSAYLSRTPASAGDRKTWTWSGWVKRSLLGDQKIFNSGSGDDSTFLQLFFGSDNKLRCATNTQDIFETNAVFRDLSAWYQIVWTLDTTQATASNRTKLYVNGAEIDSFSTDGRNLLTQNSDKGINKAGIHYIGTLAASSNYYNGYMTEIHFIDGQALTPSSFGEINATTGVWSPIAYAGTYGTNGFYLDFSDNTSTTTLGYDAAGSNDWTLNNFSVTAGAGNDSLVDSPTRYGTDTGAGGEVRGNYCTLNPLDADSSLTLANGNLQVSKAVIGWTTTRSTLGMSSGKWYWEVTQTATGASAFCIAGIATSTAPLTNYLGSSATGYGYGSDGAKYNNGAATAYAATWTTNDTIGVAFDADAGTLTFYKNGVSQGTAYSSIPSGDYMPAVSLYNTITEVVNFGQRPFAHTAPSGFKALCTTNLPDPTVVQGDDYFNTLTWTGDNTANRSITGVGFQPDFVWVKQRSTTRDHVLFDAVRAAGNALFSNLTVAEDVGVTSMLSSFNSDGFTVGQSSYTNANAGTYVAWNWKANGAGSSNTDGTITSTVSANTTAGISIVTYTGNTTAGATVGHGLGVAPKMIFYKLYSGASSWIVYHASVGATKILVLNTTAAEANSNAFNNTAPSSTVFSLGGSGEGTNDSSMLAYCFAEVEGFSKFGSYTGNGSADGPFVYTGFRPACIITKRTSDTDTWIIWDTARDPYNLTFHRLFPAESAAESTTTISATSLMDILSNGFKFRGSSDDVNGSGATYIFAAFAENPFKTSLAR